MPPWQPQAIECADLLTTRSSRASSVQNPSAGALARPVLRFAGCCVRWCSSHKFSARPPQPADRHSWRQGLVESCPCALRVCPSSIHGRGSCLLTRRKDRCPRAPLVASERRVGTRLRSRSRYRPDAGNEVSSQRPRFGFGRAGFEQRECAGRAPRLPVQLGGVCLGTGAQCGAARRHGARGFGTCCQRNQRVSP